MHVLCVLPTGFEHIYITNYSNQYPLSYWIKLIPLAPFIINKLMQSFRVGDPSQSIELLKLFLKQESYEKTLEYFNYTLYEYMPGSLLIKILGTIDNYENYNERLFLYKKILSLGERESALNLLDKSNYWINKNANRDFCNTFLGDIINHLSL